VVDEEEWGGLWFERREKGLVVKSFWVFGWVLVKSG
jgi:hypothetical protein